LGRRCDVGGRYAVKGTPDYGGSISFEVLAVVQGIWFFVAAL
jgi:hypothetical protein